MYYFKRKQQQVKRVLDFLPIIWRGFDFDYVYALELFEHQLSRTADFLESDKACNLEAKNNAKQIRKVLAMLKDTYHTEDTCMKYFDEVEEKYPGAMDCNWVDTKKNNGSSFLKLNYEYWDNAEEVEAYLELRRRLSNVNYKILERKTWDLIYKNIGNWWS